jgi:hypothetical protein
MKYYCIESATKDKPGVCVLPTMQEPEKGVYILTIPEDRKAYYKALDDVQSFKNHLASLPKFPTSCDRAGWFEASEERYETKLGSAWYRCSKWVYDNAVRRGASVRKFIVPQSKEGAIKELKEITNGHWDKFNSNEEINKELGRESEEKDLAPEEWSVRVRYTLSYGHKDTVLVFDHKPTECEIEQNVDHWAKQKGLGQRHGCSAEWGDPVLTSERDVLPSLTRKADHGTEAGKQTPVEQKDEPRTYTESEVMEIVDRTWEAADTWGFRCARMEFGDVADNPFPDKETFINTLFPSGR